ncbi:MAG: hypothetical protein IKU23_05760 [Clostridia bacterium]|nr:hypothetical protein [Clostridia bacterium]
MNQKEFDEIFDMKAENKPQKTFDPRTKKKLILALCVAIGLIIGVAVGLIIDATVFITGASTPEDAVAGYLEASLLQDVDEMVRYSSEYNSLKLGDGVKRNNNELRQFLNNQYKNKTPSYKEEDIRFEQHYIRNYEKGKGKYDIIIGDYEKIIADGSKKIDEIAIVRMTLFNGKIKNPTPKNYIAVKQDGKWYYAFAWVEE